MSGTSDWINPLLIGQSGAGKTAVIEEWCRKHNINLIKKLASHLDEADVGGAIAADLRDPEKAVSRRLGSTEFSDLKSKDSILFIDELNTARPNVATQLFSIINEHTDPEDPNGKTRIRNYLFTIAAMNPTADDMDAFVHTLPSEEQEKYRDIDWDELSYEGTFPLSAALAARFIPYFVEPDVDSTKAYLDKKFNKQIDVMSGKAYYDDETGKIIYYGENEAPEDFEVDEDEILAIKRRKALGDFILSHEDFSFDDYKDAIESRLHGNHRLMMPRGIEQALELSDGTKESFLKAAKKTLNSTRQQELEDILGNYVDKEDKANDVFKKIKTQSTYLNNQGVQDKLNKLAELNDDFDDDELRNM